VKALGDGAITVLGNHDLHLLCVAEGVQKVHKRDTLEDVLDAPDRDELLAWLRSRPLMHVEGSFALVHAGLLPEWTVAKALELAREVEFSLRASDYRKFMADMYGNEPDRWDDALAGIDRLRVIVNAMTRMRVCTPDGRMALEYKGEPGETRGAMIPWFDMPRRKSADHTLVVGHWSALGLLERTDVLALDTGCVWGRTLSAVRLEDRKVFHHPCSP
jgi:bis(5'-nucleosyl)-tetraphosphatase (symmetrical)